MRAYSVLPKSFLFICLLAGTLVFLGCGQGDGTLDIAGSTTVQPIAEKLALAYMTIHPDRQVIVTGGGSGTGIRSVANGVVDIGTASRELTDEESAVLTKHRIATDGIAIVVHPALDIDELTLEEQEKQG